MNRKILAVAVVMALTLVAFTEITKEKYTVSVDKSKLTWTGYHLAKSYEHTGVINLKSGELDLVNGKVTGGSFVIDMNTISTTDLEGGKKDKLDGHLRSEDFFAVEQYPEAKLVINKVEGSKAEAEITIRGITAPVSFDFNTENTADGNIVATAKFNIDRSKHKVLYGWTLENAMISNEFAMEVSIVASK